MKTVTILIMLAAAALGGYFTGRNGQVEDAFSYNWTDVDQVRKLETLLATGQDMRYIDVSDGSLRGLSLPNANLFRATLADCELMYGDFRGSNLQSADLSGAQLWWAEMGGASLKGADIRKADLSGSSMVDVDLTGADADSAYLLDANLRGADLRGANLTKAYLAKANLQGARVDSANLATASLMWADLDGLQGWETITDVTNLNVFEVKNPPPGFVAWALEHGAVSLPHEEWKSRYWKPGAEAE